ncbi:MAG: GNAT family N-acetyltransferase [Dehalococcoidia bacterium]
MTFHIRPSVPADHDAVLALWREGAAFATTTDDLDGLGALHARDDGALLIAEDGPRLVGSVIAGWDGWRGGIYRIVVAPSHRRRGVGRELVRAAVTSLLERGVRRIAAVVEGEDAQAMAFWGAMDSEGFVHDAGQTRFVRGTVPA